MSDTTFNKYRAAVEILYRSRDRLVEAMADDVLDQADDLIENGYAFNEFIENQGTRLHFLSAVVTQLEQSADVFDETAAASPPPRSPKSAEAPKKRRTRAKKLPQQAPTEGSTEGQ